MPKNKYGVFFIFAIVLLFCNACSYNRMAILSPIEPYIFEENGINFGRSSYRDGNMFLSFDLPLLTRLGTKRFGLEWNMYIISDNNIDNIFLEGISLSINDLDVTVSKQNLNHPLPSLPQIVGDEQYNFIVVEDDDATIYIDEIRDAVSEKLSILNLYKKFKKVKTATFTLEFRYTIDGEEKNTTIVRHYNVKCETTNAFWDNWMGI